MLEWEFKEEIPRSRLRAAYGEGFKGAPLRCDPASEGVFSRDETARDAQACSQEVQAAYAHLVPTLRRRVPITASQAHLDPIAPSAERNAQ